MNTVDELENQIKRLRLTVSDALDQRILDDASAALAGAGSQVNYLPLRNMWRIIMNSKGTPLAAALLLAVIVGVVILHQLSTSAAYAVEQTLQANRGLRSIHIRADSAGEVREIWAEFGDDGQLSRLRINLPQSDDGDKQIVWQGDKAEVWFKAKQSVLVLRDRQTLEKISKELTEYDPKVIMDRLYDAQAKAKVKIETQQPSDNSKPITLVVRPSDALNKQEIYQVNPKTKLLEQLKKYDLVDGQFKLSDTIQFSQYNEEIPAATFVLNVPADVTRVDWMKQEVGVTKGDLSDNQISIKVARDFFEALIAKNYAKAGSIMSGTPETKMKDSFGKLEFLRIVSIGDPKSNPDAGSHTLQVPCDVELRVNGKNKTETFQLNVRPVDGQPDRWLVSGGI